MMSEGPSIPLIQDLYARMLMARMIDDYAWRLHKQEYIDFVASCRGYEAAQVASAVCIEVGKDFTLPYYRDLGVVLTIGMTPYEVFRTYLQAYQYQAAASSSQEAPVEKPRAMLHWGYHKHNTITDSAPTATQILHAAGIAFSCKLRKAPVVTVAYCSDGAAAEPEFAEAITFASQHRLPIVFIYEQDRAQQGTHAHGSLSNRPLPMGLMYRHIDGRDVITVYEAMRGAMQHARDGQGPVLLEMSITHLKPPVEDQTGEADDALYSRADAEDDPLLRCQDILQQRGAWDDEWARQLTQRIRSEVERAMQEALRDIS